MTALPDAASFDACIAPLMPQLLAHAARILVSEDLAADAVQVVLERTWRRGWLPAEPLPALLHLVRRASLTQLRSLRRRADHEALAATREDCCECEAIRRMEREDAAGLVRDAVSRLCPLHGEVVQAVDLEGLGYEEASARLGVPIGTVRSRLSRARRQLRDDLGSIADLSEVA